MYDLSDKTTCGTCYWEDRAAYFKLEDVNLNDSDENI
jgi:hypothetical protein